VRESLIGKHLLQCKVQVAAALATAREYRYFVPVIRGRSGFCNHIKTVIEATAKCPGTE
jgi:hypothetical protein